MHHSAGFHTVTSLDKDVKLVVGELTEQVKPLSYSSHKNIKVTKPVMKTLDSTKFHKWMKEKWSNILAGLL